jgi:membrane protein DedA with SNARE-associated domain
MSKTVWIRYMGHLIPETLNIWLTQYGSFALFVLLALGIFALPLPDETLLVFAGVLIAKHQLELIPTIMCCIGGSLLGITLSYFIGKTAGIWLIRKYGHWVRLTEARMEGVHNWFERIGCWALLIGYFIPGVRHMTGYAAGITELDYRKFALFAYTGAVVWVGVFLSMGYFLGNKWVRITDIVNEIGHTALFIILALAVCAGLFTWWRIRRSNSSCKQKGA